MLTSALTTKGQVTIPQQIRQRLHLQPGDRVGFVVENDQVTLFRKLDNVEAAFGLYRAKRTASLTDMERGIRKRIKEDYERQK